jgi:ribonuclease HI
MDKNKLVIFCDGGARGNPGPGASSFIIFQKGKEIVRYSKYLGKTTNNVAEYYGVLFALKWVDQNNTATQGQDLVFNLDSQLVVRQLMGVYKIKDAKLKVLTSKIKKFQENINKNIYFNHIAREKNKLADRLVNKAIDENTN